MSHAIGGRFPLFHGEVNAALLPYVMEFNFLAVPQKYKEIAELCGIATGGMTQVEAGEKAIEFVKKLSLDIGAPQRLSDMGWNGDMIEEMSQIALEDACMITNPRDITLHDVKNLFRKAL